MSATHSQTPLNTLWGQWEQSMERATKPSLPDAVDGNYISESDHGQPKTFIGWWTSYVDAERYPSRWIWETLGMLCLLPFDAALIVTRVLLLPLVWCVWHAERLVGRLLGVHYFCPICHHATANAYVYCPKCHRVQGRLRPSLHSLFRSHCACGRHSWPTLGNFLLLCPRPLVCRSTRATFGCYRPNPCKESKRPTAPDHVVIMGPSPRANHVVLAHTLLQALIGSARQKEKFDTPWHLNRIEAEICRQELVHAFTRDTRNCERNAVKYGFARSVVLRGASRRDLVVHQVSQSWLASEADFYSQGPSWVTAKAVLFAVDIELALQEHEKQIMTHAEAFERLVRTVQHERMLAPHSPLPLRVAVMMPLPAKLAQQYLSGASPLRSEEDSRELVCRIAPSLYALLTRCTHGKNLRFFAGRVPDGAQLNVTDWIWDAALWSTGRPRSKR